MLENNKWKKTSKTKKKGQRVDRKIILKWWLLIDYCCTFSLGCFQICKASRIFESNLELALSIIVKERWSYK